jgi:hypothetical protein
MGGFIDDLGAKTTFGRWLFFLTLTYRTPAYPWIKGFPRRSEPHPDFVHHFFNFMISWMGKQFGSPVEYFCADQFGETGGRLHQHAGISSPGLSQASSDLATLQQEGKRRLPEELKPLQRMLWDRAGFNRILPWLHPASYYIGRYIGRDASRCYWQWRVGPECSPVSPRINPIGRKVIAPSPELPAEHYRGGVLRRWHR